MTAVEDPAGMKVVATFETGTEKTEAVVGKTAGRMKSAGAAFGLKAASLVWPGFAETGQMKPVESAVFEV